MLRARDAEGHARGCATRASTVAEHIDPAGRRSRLRECARQDRGESRAHGPHGHGQTRRSPRPSSPHGRRAPRSWADATTAAAVFATRSLVLASMVLPFGVGALLGPLPARRAARAAPRCSARVGDVDRRRRVDGGARSPARRVASSPALALIAPLAHLAFSRSAILATLDALTFLFVGLGVPVLLAWPGLRAAACLRVSGCSRRR
jgi:hypothetical protein